MQPKVDWNLIGESLISNSPAMRENAVILSEADGAPKHILDRIVSMTAEDPHLGSVFRLYFH